MNKYNKWFRKAKYQREILDTNFVVYTFCNKIKMSLFRITTIDLFYNKELEIIFANIRV
jgi:hypothetical protein